MSISWDNRKSQESRNYGDILIPQLKLQSLYFILELYSGNKIGHYGHDIKVIDSQCLNLEHDMDVLVLISTPW